MSGAAADVSVEQEQKKQKKGGGDEGVERVQDQDWVGFQHHHRKVSSNCSTLFPKIIHLPKFVDAPVDPKPNIFKPHPAQAMRAWM